MRVKINESELFRKLIKENFQIKMNEIPRGITIDSRLHQSGDVYLPINGDNFDGHDFISNVLDNNPSLVISEKKLNIKFPILNTQNNRQIIHQIVAIWQKKMNSKIIGITGSNGKTTTKELAYHVLSKSIKCFKTKENYNTVLSSPLSFLSAKHSQEISLIEMGTNQPGEIKSICDVMSPEIGLITNISNAHAENFNSNKDIAIEKGNLFKSLPENGIAIINNDDKYIREIKTKARETTYGFIGEVDFKGKIINQKNISVNNQIVELPISGYAMAQNVLAVFALASTLGLKNNEINSRISSFKLPNGRGNILEIGELKIIDDTYNANPVSMIAGLRRLSNKNAKRKIAILGDMLELGSYEEESHIQIGEFLNKSNIDIILSVGDRMKLMHKKVEKNKTALWFKSNEGIINFIKDNRKDGDLIYLKGSRFMVMEKIIEGIK
tara:strand:- start:1128 stop:2447 length:1320 start_codon:yes stop_codon:yes gene_type:complete